MDVLKAIYRREFELYEEIFAIRYGNRRAHKNPLIVLHKLNK